MKRLTIVLVLLALVALVVGGIYISARNQIVTKNQAVKAQWSQVDVVLQRRADLIPNLVETVKGIATQEQTVFGDIAKARSQLLGAQTPADVHIRRLRERIEVQPESPQYIQTVRGAGYRFSLEGPDS